MVEEGSRGAANILDMPLAIREGKFAVFPADDLGFEADGSLGWLWRVGSRDAISFRVSADSDDCVFSRKGAGDGGER
jgi:hypothetical protein